MWIFLKLFCTSKMVLRVNNIATTLFTLCWSVVRYQNTTSAGLFLPGVEQFQRDISPIILYRWCKRSWSAAGQLKTMIEVNIHVITDQTYGRSFVQYEWAFWYQDAFWQENWCTVISTLLIHYAIFIHTATTLNVTFRHALNKIFVIIQIFREMAWPTQHIQYWWKHWQAYII